MLPTLSIGSLVLPTGGLVYILGAYVMLSAVERAAGRLGLDVEKTYATAATAVVGAFVGARLVFVARFWSAFAADLSSVVWPLTSGFDPAAGVLIGAAVGFFYARQQQLPSARTLDALLPGIVTGLAVVSLADFLAGPGYGTSTTAVWGIDLFGVRRHPVQLYEIAAAAVAGLAWWRVVRQGAVDGRPFLTGLAAYSAGRLLVDAYRANAWLTNGGWHLVQIAALLLMLAALVALARPHLRPAA